MPSYRMDKTVFKATTHEEAEQAKIFDKDTPLAERIRQAWFLTLYAYGYSPENPPRMDKTVFVHRKRND